MNSDFDTKLAIASLSVSSVSLFFTALIGWIALRFSAKPRLVATLSADHVAVYHVGELCVLTFNLRNVGWFYARPPATAIRVFVNVHRDIELIKLRYGSSLELSTTGILPGKNNLNYLEANGIELFYHEKTGENIELTARMPTTAGYYCLCLSLRSAEGAYAKLDTLLQVVVAQDKR